MIIGIDMRMLSSRHRSGVEEYAEQIISRLAHLAPNDQFKLFFSSFRNYPPKFSWLNLPNVRVYHYHIPNRLLFICARFFNWPKLDVLMNGADVFFSPHFFLAPLSENCRRVTTFHDLSYKRFPEFFTLNQRLWHRFMRPTLSARFSDRIIAVSGSTKADLVEYYHVDPANISVIYNSASLTRPTDAELETFKRNRQLPARFIFSIGTLEPRKNTDGIIRAFNILKSRPGFEDVQLVFGGNKGWECENVFKELEQSPYSKDIRYLGYISDNPAYYYSLASVFVYPSFFEGFGLPVIDAMACGAPVITSTTSSMPEITGNAALLVDPYNISAIASAMETILNNPKLADSLRVKGLGQSRYFNWDKAASETLEVIHRE
jgi:glycosyltransferase involved in cell wall biosynthesis